VDPHHVRLFEGLHPDPGCCRRTAGRERSHRRRSNCSALRHGSNRCDEANVADALALLPAELRNEARLREMAARLVRRQQAEIMIVAAHLVLKKQLSGAEVDDLMKLAEQ